MKSLRVCNAVFADFAANRRKQVLTHGLKFSLPYQII